MCVGHKLIKLENLVYQQTFMLSSDINGECCAGLDKSAILILVSAMSKMIRK